MRHTETAQATKTTGNTHTNKKNNLKREDGSMGIDQYSRATKNEDIRYIPGARLC